MYNEKLAQAHFKLRDTMSILSNYSTQWITSVDDVDAIPLYFYPLFAEIEKLVTDLLLIRGTNSHISQIEARGRPCEECLGSGLKYLGENDRWLCEECWTTEHVDMIDTAYANTYKETRIE